MGEELVTIARFETGMAAHEASFVLEDEGVECAIDDEIAVTLAIPGSVGLGGVKLLVREADAERAARILAKTPAAKDLVVEVDEEGDEGS